MAFNKFSFIVNNEHKYARCGKIFTPHGTVDTPTFMPVGTQGTIKSAFIEDVILAGSQIILSMARSTDPNSANSQFFICLADAPHLDRNYTAFGRVIEGMEHVDKIKKGEDPNGAVKNPDIIVNIRNLK